MSSTNNGGTQYTINFVNNSPNTGSMVVFQQPVSMEMDGVMSLAWFAKKVHPTTSLSFEWNTTLNFVWSETGKLDHGIHFSDSQTPEADITGNNSIQLTYDGAFNFINQTAANIPGSLCIKQDETIPVNKASVGIGMSGAGTFVVQAQPNMEAVFTPHPEYWVAFGKYEKGEVLNVQEMSNCTAVNFPPGIFAMDAILNPDNTWTIQPSEG